MRWRRPLGLLHKAPPVLLGVSPQPRLASLYSLFHLHRIGCENNPTGALSTTLYLFYLARGHNAFLLDPKGLFKPFDVKYGFRGSHNSWRSPADQGTRPQLSAATTSNNVKPSPLRSIIAGSSAGAVEIGTLPSLAHPLVLHIYCPLHEEMGLKRTCNLTLSQLSPFHSTSSRPETS